MKTKAKLICVFVFTYAKSRFSHDAAHILTNEQVSLKVKVTWLIFMTNIFWVPCLLKVLDYMSLVMRKLALCICENKDADQLREADQRLCFRYIDSTIPLLSKSEISSL